MIAFPRSLSLSQRFVLFSKLNICPHFGLLFLTETPVEECNNVTEQYMIVLIPEHLQIQLHYAPVRSCKQSHFNAVGGGCIA